MAKRTSNPDSPGNDIETPLSAAVALRPYLYGVRRFAEPCAGQGKLIGHLEGFGLTCVYHGDIKYGRDCMVEQIDRHPIDAIITNPPWERKLLYPMIERFMQIAPTWLLFQSDWAYTRKAARYLRNCSHIVAVGRVRWIPGTKHTGFENCSWYRFHAQHFDVGPKLIPASEENAVHDDAPRRKAA